MHDTIRQLFIDALESGEYKRIANPDNNGCVPLRYQDGWSARGVLIDIYRKHRGGLRWVKSKNLKGYYTVKKYIYETPDFVLKWAGLTDTNETGLWSKIKEADRACNGNFDEVLALLKNYSNS